MTTRSWARKLLARTPRTVCKDRARFRPTLEVLEDRLTPSTLGTTALLEGPAAGSATDIVVSSGPWSASANDTWLHTSAAGTGNGLATLTFDANQGATRSGTLTIAGQTLTVTQAGSTYVTANGLTTLVPFDAGLGNPNGVAVDRAGNVYISDNGNNTIEEWHASTQQLTTLVSSGLNNPTSVAVDVAGNVYIADGGNYAIKEWHASTQQLTTLVSTGLSTPYGVAVDGAGNVFFSETGTALAEWHASTRQVTTLAFLGEGTYHLAVDVAGNVYFSVTTANAIKEWSASTRQVTTLVQTYAPTGVAVDAAGNVYFSVTRTDAIKEWSASTGQVTTLVSSGLSFPTGVAVDGAGNVYIADTANKAIEEVPQAFVPGGPVTEGAAAGSDALAPVLPTAQSLTGAFAPSSDQNWLTLGAIANGVVNFSFTANTDGVARTAHITELGQQITVTQAAPVAITITVTGYSVTYDGTVHTASGTATGAGNVDFSADLNLGGTQHTSAGPYTDTWTFHDPTGTYHDASGTVSDQITPATLTVTPTAGQSKTYGAPVPTLTCTASGFANGDPASILSGALGTTATAASPVGNYAFTTGSLTAGPNYTVVLVANTPTFAVTPATLTVTANTQTKIYGSADPTLTYVASGLQFTDTVATVLSGSLTRAAGETVAGAPYAITIGSLSAGSNYTIAFTGSTLTITPATLTVTANPQTKVYGSADPTLTYTVSGLQFSDTTGTVLRGSLTRVAGETVAGGPYAISLGTLAANTNYTIVFTGNSLAITPATLTVTADPQTKVYGSADPTLTYAASGLQFADTMATVLSGGLTRAAGETVAGAPYAITIGSLSAGSNYTIAFTGSTLTITPATLIVTAGNLTKIAGEANPTFTVSYNGFVLGEGPSVLGGTLSFSTTATASSPPGTYAITPGGLTSSNYAITFVSGTLTVLSYSQATTNLVAQVDAACLAHGMQSSLDSQLQAAIASFSAGNTTDGVSQLQAFIHHVSAQRGKKIDGALADALIAAAQRIINAAQ
jgi:sugar lactone lactonase YvrE